MIKNILIKLANFKSLSTEEMEEIMLLFMKGKLTDAQGASFLMGLKMKGETAEELYAAAKIMRQLSTKVNVDNPGTLVDPVGTGGAAKSLVNISTASAIVASSSGVRIAKHGSRAASSKSGSADFLEAAGVKISLDTEKVADCISRCNLGFLFAPSLHTAMKNVIHIRKEMAVPTFFNLLGPLTNPAGAKKQVLGVSNINSQENMAKATQKLGQSRVMTISSFDGLDEISIAAKTNVIEAFPDRLVSYTINPRDFGIYYENLNDVVAENPSHSFKLVLEALSGKESAVLDMIAINAAAIIYVNSDNKNMKDSFIEAKEAILSGRAKKQLDIFIKISNTI